MFIHNGRRLGKDEMPVDETWLDTLMKRLATAPLSRSTALRGLAAGATALIGLSLPPEPGVAGNNKRNGARRRVCLWSSTSADGNTKKVTADKARKILRSNACARSGRCTGANPCFQCSAGTTNCGGVCRDLQCDEANCGTCGTACSAHQVCQAGACFSRSTCEATTEPLCATANPTACNSQGGNTCVCSLSAEGNIVCTEPPASCPSPTGPTLSCTTSLNCPSGSACVVFSGPGCSCPAGAMGCVPACPTPAAV